MARLQSLNEARARAKLLKEARHVAIKIPVTVYKDEVGTDGIVTKIMFPLGGIITDLFVRSSNAAKISITHTTDLGAMSFSLEAESGVLTRFSEGIPYNAGEVITATAEPGMKDLLFGYAFLRGVKNGEKLTGVAEIGERVDPGSSDPA